MKKMFKKTVSVLLIIVMLVCSAPLQGFIGLDIPSWFASKAKAAYEHETYWAMSHEEAINFIGFMYDKSKVTDDMMNAGGVYKLLTGGFEKGSIEEYSAKLAFLTTAKTNLRHCLSSYDTMMNGAYQFLKDYFEDQLSTGSIAESTAWDVADEIVDYCDEIIEEYTEGAASISAECLSLKSAYSNASNALDVIETLIVGLGGFNYVWSSSKKDMYTYVSSYISNRNLKNSCSEAFDLINDYNKFALTDGFDYDFILDWASDDHIATLERFGDYIYFVSKSFNYKESVSEPTDDLSEYKVIDVQCPTNVYVYNRENELLLSIVDNIIVNNSTDISASVYNNKKRIALPLVCEYNVVIEGTNEGTMDYFIYEIFDDSIMRTVEYDSVPLTMGCEYTTSIPQEVYTETQNYNLISNTGEVIESTHDSLPPVEDNITDVIVAEELFDGFSKELIDKVADTMFNLRSSVDVSSYNITIDDIMGLFSAIQKYYPGEYSILSKTDFSYKVLISPSKGIVTGLRFYYDEDVVLSVYQKRVKDLKEQINKLVVQTNGMSEFEKVLFIHDYIVLNCEYDYELLEMIEADGTLDGDIASERYTEYSVLVNGTGVCGSYALAYRAVLNAAGVECLYLSSAEMNHAWNLVKIDGNWYHCDLTWDDTGSDNEYHYGIAERTYFLRTDTEMMELNHRNWTPGQYKSTDRSFSDMPRFNANIQKYDEGRWYYYFGGTLCKSDIYGNNTIELGQLSASSIDVDNGSIFFANGKYIYSLAGDENKICYALSKKMQGSQPAMSKIKNFYADGENLTLYVSAIEENNDVKTTKYFDNLQKDKFNSITGITISSDSLSLDVFDTHKLTATVSGNGDFSDAEITWSSMNDNIASIDSEGQITAANVGTTTVFAEFYGYKASCNVTISGDGLQGLYGDNVKWSFAPETGTLTISGSGSTGNYFIKGSAPWYYLRNSIKIIDILDDISSIGRYSFYKLKNLSHVNIGRSVLDIGFGAFYGCTALKEITIPDNVESISNNVFRFCRSLERINIGSGLKSWGIFKPGSGSYMELEDCKNLKYIDVDINNPSYYSDDGILLNKKKTTIYACPAMIDKNEYNIPNTVTSIGDYAFMNNRNIEHIDFPDSITYIGHLAFCECKSLTNIKVLDNITDISSVFKRCSNLRSIEISDANPNYTIVENALFDKEKSTLIMYLSGKDDKFYSIPKTVTEIKREAFFGTKHLENIEIHENVKSIGIYAFAESTSIKNINVSVNNQNYSSIDGVLFNKSQTSLIQYPGGRDNKSYTVPNTVNTIDYSAFNCSQNLITINLSNVCTIDGYAFANSKNLENLVIPYSVNQGMEPSFYDCNSLSKVCFLSPNYDFNDGGDGYDIRTIPTNTTIYGHAGSTAQKYAEKNGNKFINIDEPHEQHDYFLVDYIEKTSTTDGYKKYWCYCGKSEYIIPLHYFGKEVTTGPTCFENGAVTKTCVNCGYVETISTIECSGKHDYKLIKTVSADCANDGYKKYKCSVCGDEYTKAIYSDDGHSMVETVIKPTCISKGYTTATCSTCGATQMYDFTSPLGHKLKLSKVTENCTAHGSYVYSCSRCDYQETVAIKTDGLNTQTETIPATCTVSGSEKQVCKLCGATVSTKIIPAKGHNFGTEYTVDVPATCTTEGSKSIHCKNCEIHILTETVKPAGHNFGAWTTVSKPSCIETVLEERICKNDANHVEQRELPKTGHIDNDDDGYCDNCKIDLGTHTPDDPTDDCSCLCHTTGIFKIFWKIINFFRWLFGIEEYHYCACGVNHW